MKPFSVHFVYQFRDKLKEFTVESERLINFYVVLNICSIFLLFFIIILSVAEMN